jgi:transposase-like protein
MVFEVREHNGGRPDAIARVADQLGINRETLRTWSSRPRSTAASAQASPPPSGSASPRWNVRSGSCAAPTRF